MAQRAASRKPTTPYGHRVKLALTLFLPRHVAEYLTARAIVGGGDPRSRGSADVSRQPFPHVSCSDLPRGPDAASAWIKLDLLTRRLVGRRLEAGPTADTDEEHDKLMRLRPWKARRLVN